MKRIVVLIAVLAISFISASIVHAANTFALLDSRFTISGYLDVNEVVYQYPDNWQTIDLFNGAYNVTSPTPISDELRYGSIFVSSEASYNKASVDCSLGGPDGFGRTASNAVLTFKPNFDGEGPHISFSGNRYAGWSMGHLTDLTTGDLLFEGFTEDPNTFYGNSPYWYSDEVYYGDVDADPTYYGDPAYGWFLGDDTFRYDAWDSSHIYQLDMYAEAQEYIMGEMMYGMGPAYIRSDITFVPEPVTIILLSLSLVGLSRARKRIFR
ncbi:MAG TPA: PEP-CTERM sorting domain-containing protein [Syntrophorhabdaceae bacterium]|nr:PEP-CTERM sorting domain-containing protein [Syntrophorhabdaceae bacterium]